MYLTLINCIMRIAQTIGRYMKLFHLFYSFITYIDVFSMCNIYNNTNVLNLNKVKRNHCKKMIKMIEVWLEITSLRASWRTDFSMIYQLQMMLTFYANKSVNLIEQCQNSMNLRSVSNPPKIAFNWAPA